MLADVLRQHGEDEFLLLDSRYAVDAQTGGELAQSRQRHRLKVGQLQQAQVEIGDQGRGGWQSTTDGIKKYAKQAGLTLREVALGATTPRHAFIGTSVEIADTMQAWFEAGAADGFMLDCPVLPSGMTEFTEQVLPILVDRGLFRREYEAETLRENLGLAGI